MLLSHSGKFYEECCFKKLEGFSEQTLYLNKKISLASVLFRSSKYQSEEEKHHICSGTNLKLCNVSTWKISIFLSFTSCKLTSKNQGTDESLDDATIVLKKYISVLH